MKKIISILIIGFILISSAWHVYAYQDEDKDREFLRGRMIDIYDHGENLNDTEIVNDKILSQINPTFVRTWGGDYLDSSKDMIIYDDYVYVCGWCDRNPDDKFVTNVFIAKYDLAGNIMWSKIWDKNKYEMAFSLSINKGFIYIVGFTGDFSRDLDAFLLKYDLDGDLIWEKIWKDTMEDRMADECFVYDDEIIICGTYAKLSNYQTDVFLMKCDLDGNILFETSWGDNELDYGDGLSCHNDFIYITGMSDWDLDNFIGNIILLKYDIEGNLILEKKWSLEDDPSGCALDIFEEKIYITGSTNQGYGNADSSIFLLKCDLNGNINWLEFFNGGDFFESGRNLFISNNFVFISGGIDYDPYSSDVVLLKYDLEGNLLFNKTWGNPGVDDGSESIYIYEDFVYLSGRTTDINTDAMILKCNSDGEPGNNNPDKPDVPNGPNKGKRGETFTFTCSTNDVDDEKVRFLFDWGDGNSTWTDWVDSGVDSTLSNSWETSGNYEVKIRARDEKGGDSEWSDPLSIKITKNKGIHNLFEKLNFCFNNRYSKLFLILKQIGEKI